MDADDLCQIFDSSFQIVESLDQNNILESSSDEFQDLVTKGIRQLEKATQLINTINLFSTNESLDEVTSTDIKYLLTPALLAYLSEKCLRRRRNESVEAAQVYYNDFLKRLRDYEVIPPAADDDDQETEGVRREPDLRDVARNRQAKIERYRKKKDLTAQIESMKNHGQDDEQMRKYHILLLKKWTETAIEELESLKMESQLLQRAGKSGMSEQEHNSGSKSRKPREPFKPFIITRNDIQKKVYGLGYPSIPTMTVDEFVDQKEKDGTWAFSNKKMYVLHS